MTAWFLVVFSLQHAHTHPTACSQGLLSLHAVITLIMSGSAGYIIVSNYKKRRIFIAQQVCTSAAAVFFCAAHRLRRYHILRSVRPCYTKRIRNFGGCSMRKVGCTESTRRTFTSRHAA